MQRHEKFYIDGEWVGPVHPGYADLINPSTESEFATVATGGVEDVNKAVPRA